MCLLTYFHSLFFLYVLYYPPPPPLPTRILINTLIPPLSLNRHLLTHFVKSHQPAFLYQGSILISEFGDAKHNGIYETVLFNMVSGFSETVFSVLTDLSAFTNNPEVKEQ